MRTLIVCFLFFSAVDGARADDFKSVKSLFTDRLIALAKKTTTEKPLSTPPIDLECFQVPGNDLYIGVKQMMDVNASLPRLDAILRDFDHYHELFPGLKKASIEKQEGNKLKTLWETIVPLPFVPNVKYQMIYTLESPTPDQSFYFYQLHEQGKMKFSDGFISLKKMGENITRYVEYDFFEADWGPAKIMGSNKLWYDSIEGIAHSDLALKLKAENPTWNHERARKEAGWSLKSDHIGDRIQHCIKNKVSANL